MERGPRVAIRTTGIKAPVQTVGRSEGITMRIAAPKISEKIGTLRLTEFKTSPLSKHEKPAQAFTFRDTVPFIAPTIAFAPIADPKPAPLRTEPKRFGEFKPQPETNLLKPIERSFTLPTFETVPPVRETAKVEQQITAIRRELRSMVISKTKKKPTILPNIESMKAERRTIQITQPSTKEIVSVVKDNGVPKAQIVLEQKYRTPISLAELTKIASEEKTDVRTPTQSERKATQVSVEHQIVNKPDVGIKKLQREQVIVDFGGNPKEVKEKKIKFIKDKPAMGARKARAMLIAAMLYAEKVYNTFGRYTGLEKYTVSGKELAGQMGAPSNEVVSGLAKKTQAKDNTLDLIASEVSTMQETESLGDAIMFITSVVDKHPAVDVKAEDEAKGEEPALPAHIAQVLLGSLTD